MRIVFIFILLFSRVPVQSQDSLVTFSQMSFDSDFEKESFRTLGTHSPDYFNALIALSDEPDRVEIWRGQYESRIDAFKTAKRPNKNEKYLKRVYEFVHDEFLRKYELVVNFDLIFQKGVYNCVTACALYGLVFEDLGIPFVVKETPTHVYIVAYPDSEQIGIETTDPLSGFKTFSLGFKEAFVSQLAALKLIDQSELSAGVNKIFDKYYFTDQNLGLRELIGLQYYNQGIVALNSQDYKNAFKHFQKAYFLHPSENIRQQLGNACVLSVSQADYNVWMDVEMLTSLMRVNHPQIGKPEILGEFSRLMNNQLGGKNDTLFVSEAYRRIRKSTTDIDLINELDYYYNYERGRALYNRGNYRLSIPFIKDSFNAKPGNFDVENLLVSSINNALVAKVYTSDELFDLLDHLYNTYPQLNSNAHLGSLKLSLYLEAMANAYQSNEADIAQKYQSMFEESVDKYGFRYQEYQVSKAYSQGITYYFRKGWYKSARNVLNSGFKYAPQSSELKMRKYWLDKAQD